MSDRLSDEQVATIASGANSHAFGPGTITLAREVQERRAADTHTPSFTDDEMTAIFRLLRGVHCTLPSIAVDYCCDECLRGTFHKYNAPQSVIAWVLGDPSPCPSCGGEK